MGELGDLDGRLLVVFDGLCGFCNRSVRWFARRDRDDRLRFIGSQSPRVSELLARHGISADDLASGTGTMLVVSSVGNADERVDSRSAGVRKMLGVLPQPLRVVGAMMGWIPAPIRDFFYRLIARFRHRIAGRLESCPIPTVEERSRFL